MSHFPFQIQPSAWEAAAKRAQEEKLRLRQQLADWVQDTYSTMPAYKPHHRRNHEDA